MKTVLFLFVAALFNGAIALVKSKTLAAPPQTEWKTLVDRTKTCQVSVPEDWEVRKSSPSGADSRDHKLGVGMYATSMDKTFRESKALWKLMHPPIQVFEDSDRRLWISHKEPFPPEGSRMTDYFVGIPVKENVCVAEIYFDNKKLAALAKLVANSLVAAN